MDSWYDEEPSLGSSLNIVALMILFAIGVILGIALGQSLKIFASIAIFALGLIVGNIPYSYNNEWLEDWKLTEHYSEEITPLTLTIYFILGLALGMILGHFLTILMLAAILVSGIFVGALAGHFL